MDNILINPGQLSKIEMNVSEFMVLVSLYYKSNFIDYVPKSILENLEKEKYIKILKTTCVLRQKSLKLIEQFKMESDVSLEKTTNVVTEAEIKERVQEYRILFKGIKPGSMGSKRGCIDNLIKWFKENPEYSFEDVLKATKLYINTQNDIRYIQKANYFIYKQDGNKVTHSNLSSFIDEIEENVDHNDEWTSDLI